MRFFIDCEFSECGPKHPIELISIALVAENGDELYLVSSEFEAAACNDWVKENVLPALKGHAAESRADICDQIKEFVCRLSEGYAPEFWGYYADYDWVVFCQIFGAMIDLPKGWPMYCRDLKQWVDTLGNPELPKQTSTEHNAIHDARWNLEVFRWLCGFPNVREQMAAMSKEMAEL